MIETKKRRDEGGARRLYVSTSLPAPTVMAGGIGSVNTSQYQIEGRENSSRTDNKPPYRVPSMAEINAMPWNGFTVASTFSGCGGSCLGYRMAGFRVAWANEFVPSAQESYKVNAAPDCFLDYRDIKHVKPEEILERIGMKQGDLDVFDGSPPCQAFSMAGKRNKGWGKKKTYEHGATQCNETLFDEYIRLLRGLKPKMFVAENVSGLVKGTAKGYFLEIMAALRASGYRVESKMLDAQWLGVPQQRQRVIFIGVREDLKRDPAFPKPLQYRYSVRDALPWIGRVVHDTSGLFGTGDVTDRPSPTITIGVNSVNSNHFKVQDQVGLVKDFHESGGFSRLNTTDRPSPAITATQCRMTVETDISRFAIGAEWDKVKEGGASGKYFSFVKPDRDKPCPTIQASHGEPSIAGVVHPIEKRKFTIAELKRICAFPDDFQLIGSYAQQWACLGNSVPPVMMKTIAQRLGMELSNA